VSAEVKVPDIGDFGDVPVIEILVAVGDTVAPEDPLVTLESDKATMDVPAPFGGTITKLSVSIGDHVSEGSVLLEMETEGSDQSDAPEEQTPATPEPAATEPAASEPAPQPATPAPAPDGGYDAEVVVIGSGPGGYSAAFRAADLGLKTVLVERYPTLGGVCLNVGCIPSKALLHAARVITEAEEMSEHGIAFGKPKVSLEKLIAWKQSVVTRLTGGIAQMAKGRKVEVLTGEATFADEHTLRVGERTISFAHCIIAAGSEAVKLPFLPDDERIIDSTGALSPGELPKRLLVIGGGIIGLEMACVYDALGTKVTVVELMDQLIPGCDPDLVRPLAKRIEGRYEAIRLGVRVEAVKAQKNGLRVEFSDGKPQLFDQVLVAVGRRPNGKAVGAEAAGVTVQDNGFISVDRQLRTNVPHIHAIGDIVGGPMLAHKATHEGHVAAEVIAGIAGAEFDPRAIPSVAYTDPEVAWMGLTENAAKEQGIEYEKASFPWVASGRALSLGRSEGLTKLIVEPQSRRVLGAGIVGVGAGDLIAETVLALEMGADAEDVALTIHPHPTLSESVGLAAELAQGTITDLPKPRPRKQR
jgi:dihydrolipoamide dehydrogenase